jgi:hypothetical protein
MHHVPAPRLDLGWRVDLHGAYFEQAVCVALYAAIGVEMVVTHGVTLNILSLHFLQHVFLIIFSSHK